jgi:class 3 adenylate cyclase
VKDAIPLLSAQLLTEAEQSERELEKRVFHLKTLYDVSQVIGALREPQQIIKNLLMMVIGTFGARKGVIFLVDAQRGRLEAVTQRGLGKTSLDTLSQAIQAGFFAEIQDLKDIQILDDSEKVQKAGKKIFDLLLSAHIRLWIPFALNEDFQGGIGLGDKLSGESYTPDDQELLSTMANQLTVALDNALAYMEIHRLNVGLEAKVRERTAELREANHQLELHNRFIRETFGRYVSNEVVASLLESPERLQLGGQKRKVTILMSDLRGFTSLAERLAPEQVVSIINRYLSTMVDIILQYQGTINEFIGDAILVIFGAPVSREDDARRGVACAVAMQLAMASVNAENRREGLSEVEMGIGIDTGEVVVGNIGSHKRTKYGVVGSCVNLTSRIESYTIGGQILISEATRQEAGPFLKIAERLKIEAKGLEQPIALYELQGIGGEHNLFLPETEDMLAALPEELLVRYTVLEGKYPGRTPFTGTLVKLSARGAEIHSEHPVPPWSNLKMQLIDSYREKIPGDFYGKVVWRPTASRMGFFVRFTSISPEVTAFLQGLLVSSCGGPL